jgi:hypothetical protein
MRMNPSPTLISAREFVDVHKCSDDVSGWLSLAAVHSLVALGATDTSPDMYCKKAVRSGARPGGILVCPAADPGSTKNMRIAGRSSLLSCFGFPDMTASSHKDIS